jgi:hypothetical protein
VSVPDALISLIIALLTAQALVRLPAAWRGQRRERSLWGAFAAFAAAWWLRTDAGRAVIAPLGVNDLPTLLKHVLAIAGICVLLTYVTDVYHDEDATARHIKLTTVVHRIAARASLATVLCLAAVFFLALNRTKTGSDSPYFAGRHAGEPALLVYLGLFNTYVAAAAVVCGYQWGRAARHARRWALRIGLAMMAAGMSLAAVYALLRTTYLVATTLHPVSAEAGAVQEHLTDTVLYAAFLLWLLGSITPAARALLGRLQCTKALIGLHRLWRDLVLSVDGIALYAPSTLRADQGAVALINAVRDITSYDATPQIRLGRFVTEIRDVTHELRRHAPADLFVRAHQLAESHGHSGTQADAVAEAYWLKAALTVIDRPAGAPVAFSSAGDDFRTEVSWLLRVARAYRHASDTGVSSLLAPLPIPQTHRT